MIIMKCRDGFQFVPLAQKQQLIRETFREYVRELRRLKAQCYHSAAFDQGMFAAFGIAIDIAEREAQ